MGPTYGVVLVAFAVSLAIADATPMHTAIRKRCPRAAFILAICLFLVVCLLAVLTPRTAQAAVAPPSLPAPLSVPATPIVGASPTGYLADSWSVGPNGTFSDSIPLDVPAGRAGMQPGLSLNYSSSGGDGPLGMGWDVSGAVSRITRCSRTLDTEGIVAGLRFDKSDRYCLDGQKLIAVGTVGYGPGGYGETDTQYRTESDIFAQIISVASDQTVASGPDAFIVKTKGGRVLTYEPFVQNRADYGVGFDVSGMYEWQNNVSAVRDVWLLTKESDRSGNEVHWSYTGSFTVGDFRTDKITYTYNTGLLPANRYVQFVYEDRPDVVVGYQAGLRSTMPKRIKSIEMYAPNPGATSLVWRYNFVYATSATNRSLLTSVTKCAPSGACVKAKQFDWINPSMPWFTASTVGQAVQQNGGTRPPVVQVMDVNGDGLDDAVYAMGGSSDATDPVYARLGYRNPVDGTTSPLADLHPLAGALPANTDVAASRPLDLDADGKAEYAAKYPQGNAQVDSVLKWDAATSKFVSTGVTVSAGSSTDFGDLNGDGRADYLETSALAFNTGGAFGPAHPMNQATTCARRVDDLDGDGRAELITLEMSNNKCINYPFALSADDAGNVTKTPLTFSVLGKTLYKAMPPTPTSYAARSGDFNGDGLTDTLMLPTDTANPGTVLWNTGSGLRVDTHTVAVPRDQYNDVRIADVNNDGRSDIIALGATTVLMLSLGDGTFASGQIAADAGTVVPGLGRPTTQLGDFNGDGRVDIVRVVNNQLSLLTQSSLVGIDRIKAVRDEGATLPRASVTYSQSWTDHPEKIAGYTCTYPLVCQRRGLVVVRQVETQTHDVDVSPAQATTRVVRYSYEDPVSDLRGRGFLGFGTFRVWDDQRPSETITTFDQRGSIDGKYYPGAGRPWTVTTITPILSAAAAGAKPATANARVSELTYIREMRKLNGGANYAILPLNTVGKTWEQPVSITWGPLGGAGGSANQTHITGVSVPASPPIQVVASATVDDYGNMTHQSRTTSGGVTRSVDTTFDNRTDDWLIGLATSVSTTAKEANNNPPAVTRHLDNHYDDLGRVDAQYIEKGNPDPSISATVSYAYDQYGVVRSQTVSGAGQPDRVTHVEYDPFFPGQPDEEIYPSQTWSEHSVAAYRPTHWTVVQPGYGVVVASEDANGVLDTATYDDFGRAITVNPAGHAPIAYAYAMRPDKAGGTNGTIVTTTSDGRTTADSSDRLGRTIASTFTGFDGTVSTVSTGYDLLGRLVSRSRPFTGAAPSGITGHEYDSLDREIATTEPGGAQETADYTLFTTTAYDAGSHKTETTVDVDSRIVKRVAYNVIPAVSVTPITTTYEYAPFGQVSKVVDDHGNVTSFQYDVLGRRTRIDEPDRGATEMTYYPTGELHTEKRLGTGDTMTYGYDDLGRKTSVDSADGTATYAWDTSANGIGLMATATSTDGIRTDFHYDNAERTVGIDYIDQSDNNATYRVNRTYTPTGRLSGVSYPDASGRSSFGLGYTFNGHGFLSAVSQILPNGSVKPIWAVTGRNADLSLHQGVLGDSGQIGVEHTIDPVTGRLTGISATEGAQKLLGLTYGYDANGLVNSRVEADVAANRSEKYTYDSTGRLVDWKLTAGNAPTVDTGYTYDTIGDITGITRNGQLADERTIGGPNGTLPHTVAVSDATAGGGQLRSFSYDGQGRLRQTKGENDAILREITYTSQDHPRSITVNGAPTQFAYDAFGQRVKETGPDGVTFTVPGAFEKRTAGGSTSFVYQVQGTDGPVAQVTVDGSGTHTNYLLTDALGTVDAVVDGSGATFHPLWYDPFGARINADGTPLAGDAGDVRTGYTGARHDDDLGLINMNGRVYDPSLQRFTTADAFVAQPLSGQSWNPYSYVRNSPTNLVDPSGMVMTVSCGNSPYLPECGGMGGYGSWGAYGGGGLPGGGGGYDPSAFNPYPAGSTDPWHDREFQRDMAEFFGAAEAYSSGGIAGLAGWERGDLARETGGLEQEWGPRGFSYLEGKVVKSDKDGFRAAGAKTQDDGLKAKNTPVPTSSEECGGYTQIAGSNLQIYMCVYKIGSQSYAELHWFNPGDTNESIQTVMILRTSGADGTTYTSCEAGTVAPGTGGTCSSLINGLGNPGDGWGKSRDAYEGYVEYWNRDEGDWTEAWSSPKYGSGGSGMLERLMEDLWKKQDDEALDREIERTRKELGI